MERFLEIWPTWAELAKDIGAPYPTVNSWAQRGIPPRRFREVIAAAKDRGAAFGYDDLEQVNDHIASRKTTDQEDAA